ncbi:hypothetical protein [Mycobacterium kyorinense]|uniref:hypothetical protein n=1 Tax=Mycobacterium kyorinense TaxID=487514 RepID=UPI000A602C43|nr:hypothetical protein [Mycobacterium kyorinense]
MLAGDDGGDAVPGWDDPAFATAGGMVKGALWLVGKIGEGNVFTKHQLREAFPNASQIDRRIRDLRAFGWIIHSSTEDASLRAEEQRFVKAGIAVWNADERRKAAARTITAKERQATFAADGYQCVVCGIAGGELYPDSAHESAVLSVARRAIAMPDGTEVDGLVTECKRCRAGSSAASPTDAASFLGRVAELEDTEREQLRGWLRRGRRGVAPVDQAWVMYRRLPAEVRDYVRQLLD